MDPHRSIHPNEVHNFLPLDVVTEGRTDQVFLRDYRVERVHGLIPSITSLMLAIHRGTPRLVRRRFDDGWKEKHVGAGSIGIVGAGRASEWELPGLIDGSDYNVTHIYLSNELMVNTAASAFERDYRKLETIDVLSIADRDLQLFGDLLAQELRATSDGGNLVVDSLACIMSVHLIRRYHRDIGISGIIGGNERLTAIQRARVLDFINTNITRNFRMPELAEVAGLKETQFLLSFRNTFGKNPHQYVLNQRVQLAVERIRRTKLTFSEIASLTGFSDQAHMTRAVKKATGQTPGVWRKA